MPSVLQLEHMTYGHVSEVLFLGGTTITQQSETGFVVESADYRLTFSGRNLTFDEAGNLTGGRLETFYVHNLTTGDPVADIIVDSNFILLTPEDLTEAFALFAGGDAAAANQLVMDSWTAEYFSHTNYSGDDVRGYQGGDYLSSNGGNIRGFGGEDSILLGGTSGIGYGGSGNDHLYGSSGNDALYGGTGTDWIYNNRWRHDFSTDRMYGGEGNDGIVGSNIGDSLYGGAGDDDMWGSHVYGGIGDDDGHGNRFNNLMAGADGNDTMSGLSGFDLVTGGTGDDMLYGGRHDDTVAGGTGNDLLDGGSGNDQLSGDSGNDTLQGATHDDGLDGGAGDDQLFAGTGVNLLTGGKGDDGFHFRPQAATDVITDFQPGHDTIWLDLFHFADLDAVQAILTDGETGAVFDFGDGQTLTVTGISAADLLDNLMI